MTRQPVTLIDRIMGGIFLGTAVLVWIAPLAKVRNGYATPVVEWVVLFGLGLVMAVLGWALASPSRRAGGIGLTAVGLAFVAVGLACLVAPGAMTGTGARSPETPGAAVGLGVVLLAVGIATIIAGLRMVVRA
ncbi:hypothetical protein [Nocardioides sp. AE5]|uniref:hypothetical protein n=1 Tax=Nocardioides sp. AE5 TaxID=2962573 RepID=UPI0028815E79|nr:hypothetical protein [Nocardioides sp. AE5]MDT0202986.1 hypothetical protein [Nocardioides sp. AE5]